MSDQLLDKTYDPHSVEEKWYGVWNKKGYFKPDMTNGSKPYCIVIPPPNVTGSLHMGHALNNTLQDILIRYKRMKGFATLWQCGTDHAGIATQNVVERQFAQEGKSRFDVGREQFVERVWQWKHESGGTIVKQLMKLGASCDWSRERFTMDEGCSRAVREVFVTLYNEGLIYRGNKLINWCPRCLTALSDLEVEHDEIQGGLYYIKYPSPDGRAFLTVATTRPETMLGDTAIAVNPEDPRYKDWIGQEVVLPLMNRMIPVIGDSYVDLEFGTGALKITPAHDPNDFEIGLKYKLDIIQVIGQDGSMTPDAGAYAGLDRFEARKKVLADLDAQGLLEKTEVHKHFVGHCYRCKNIVEPNLSLQWFVKVGPLAEQAIAAVKDGRTRILPESWEKTYFEWMNNIRDWCISRQIWWGHRIPAWYCKACDEITVAKVDPTACAFCGSADIEQESDVLDTWFSSALWPFSTLGWPEKTDFLAKFYPVYIHALVRDSEGQKMSKSKGNVIDPLEIIDKFGTDSFRFTLTAMAAQGRDVKLSEDRIEGYRHFVNKIWNASRFAMMNLEGYEAGRPGRDELEVKDRWILSKLNDAIKKVSESYEEYRFNESANTLYHFVWHEFCDWYLEMAKNDLYQKENPRRRLVTLQVMVHVLKSFLELLHPIMPFVTEEIWQKLPGAGESIVTTKFPEFNAGELDTAVEDEIDMMIQVVSAIRNMRSEIGVPPKGRPHVDILAHDEESAQRITELSALLCSLAGLKDVAMHRQFAKPKTAATAVVGTVEIFLDIEGVINFDEERNRLQKELDKVLADIEFVGKKLGNEGFVSRAPEAVVAKEKEKLEGYQEKEIKLRNNLERIIKLCS
ncbi:MAG: valine--tRNA ligase [Proteobacteria bacterium]|nr:valine--tRNA ligase [Pseudomonadota bacterium]